MKLQKFYSLDYPIWINPEQIISVSGDQMGHEACISMSNGQHLSVNGPPGRVRELIELGYEDTPPPRRA